MKQFKVYNEMNYINSIKELKDVTFESTISNIFCNNADIKYVLSEKVSEYMEYVDKEPFYVKPNFQDVKVDNKISMLNPKFILYSAPGAVGKSSLAKYISFKFNSIYWDVSKITSGTNSFTGSILSAIGASKYSQFIDDLNNAKITLVIDAFDEAEMISGRKMINEFINDINNALENCSTPSIFMLARAETSQYIASFCAENNIALKHYEIGFFDENQARDFIKGKLKLEKNKLTQSDINCVDECYNVLKSELLENEIVSFLGYAPTLEAIATHISLCPNSLKFVNNFKENKNHGSLVVKIMEDLLDREQNQKFIAAFKKKCENAGENFADYNKLYTPFEQLYRIVYYIIFNDKKCVEFNNNVPPQLINDYQEVIDTFLPQHPFIKLIKKDNTNSSMYDFTGPAFRDYTIAYLLLNEDSKSLIDMYCSEYFKNHYMPSQILYSCYKSLNKDKINIVHLSLLYNSFSSKAKVNQMAYMQCTKVDFDEEYWDNIDYDSLYGLATFFIAGNNLDFNPDYLFLLNGSQQNVCAFNNLLNSIITFPDITVKLGNNSDVCRINNSLVICDTLEWNSDKIIIESYKPNGCLLVSRQPSPNRNVVFEIVSSEKLRVDIPNVNDFYRLVAYKYNLNDKSKIDIVKFTYSLRSIFVEFRTHKKDTMAKDAQRLDNVILKNNELNKIVFDYLFSKGIVYRDDHLYKVDMNKMKAVGINYQIISNFDCDKAINVYNDFLDFMKDKNMYD